MLRVLERESRVEGAQAYLRVLRKTPAVSALGLFFRHTEEALEWE